MVIHRSDLETMLLGVLPALAEGDAATQLRAHRHQMLLNAPSQAVPGQRGAISAPPIAVSLQDSTGVSASAAPLVHLDRVKARRLLLALLALKSAPSQAPIHTKEGEGEAA